MTPTGAKRIVLGATAITATSTAVRSLRDGKAPAPRVFLGAAFLGAMLGAAAGAAPALVAAVAVLIAIASLLQQANVLPSIITNQPTTTNRNEVIA